MVTFFSLLVIESSEKDSFFPEAWATILAHSPGLVSRIDDRLDVRDGRPSDRLGGADGQPRAQLGLRRLMRPLPPPEPGFSLLQLQYGWLCCTRFLPLAFTSLY